MNAKTDHVKNLGTCEIVMIDEYTMAPMANLATIAKSVMDKNVFISGDPNQCIPVSNTFNVINKQNIIVEKTHTIDYSNCQFFKDLCGTNRIALKYRVGGAHYGEPTNDALVNLLNTWLLPEQWKERELTDLNSLNIVRTNHKRLQIIKKITPDFAVGQRLIVTQNMKKAKIYNSSFVRLKGIVHMWVTNKGSD